MSKRNNRLLVAACGVSAILSLAADHAAPPITIGITTELGTIPGKAIANGATLAAEQINAKGGIDGR
ncbi:MAG: ABC transporter substrate-binding protein, partial [Acidiphilium sp.]|nr:ABC transporter substrate-binding protein [Acidiphilium sp.]